MDIKKVEELVVSDIKERFHTTYTGDVIIEIGAESVAFLIDSRTAIQFDIYGIEKFNSEVKYASYIVNELLNEIFKYYILSKN
ncbi:hypothetical protein K2F43_06005 [Clostridium estertheticum]|uniref:hypothetical protein n=1 Tax=Clostridium estertheticum TaxID=238834 RepID=UPI001C6E51D8|nr:hypothetical protein [Clostridium estertheticum]MBW9170759.1 hypothetical protein [Clostridium estertheticum]WLC74401.1 hypothetical protein KTC99_16745 [Clostridium estertheticum]